MIKNGFKNKKSSAKNVQWCGLEMLFFFCKETESYIVHLFNFNKNLSHISSLDLESYVSRKCGTSGEQKVTALCVSSSYRTESRPRNSAFLFTVC